MTVIYNFIATSVSGISLKKMYGFITYSYVLSIDYKIKSSIYQLIVFVDLSLYLEMSLNSRLPWWLSGKESACNVGDLRWISRPERFPGEGNGSPLQYSCLENFMDRGAGWL